LSGSVPAIVLKRQFKRFSRHGIELSADSVAIGGFAAQFFTLAAVSTPCTTALPESVESPTFFTVAW